VHFDAEFDGTHVQRLLQVDAVQVDEGRAVLAVDFILEVRFVGEYLAAVAVDC